ncbi:MAG: Abi-alpha family protein [Oceanococcaceae bacterium]
MSNNNSPAARAAALAGRFSQLARSVSEAVPGGEFVRGQLQAAETVALRTLKDRLRELDGDAIINALPAPGQPASSVRPGMSLRQTYEMLVDQSMNQSPDSAREAFYRKLLDELVPDEVRILNSASDGNVIPVVHLELTVRSAPPQRVLVNLSRIGTEAGVMLNELTPTYLTHLCSLGLLQSVGEDRAAMSKYDMIENESALIRLIETIHKQRKQKPRLVRGGLQLGPSGEALLRACGVLPPLE